jgi:shikimate kinase
MMLSNSIILIGFKHVGKSVIGRELAFRLALPFIDLDKEIELAFEQDHQDKLTCRQIMEKNGQFYFRKLEREVLAQMMPSRPSVISLGGGTPMDEENRKLIKHHTVIHITAPPGVVFERIMVRGRPAFFSIEEPAFETFNRLWNEREKIYKKLTRLCIDNDGLVSSGVEAILRHLPLN